MSESFLRSEIMEDQNICQINSSNCGNYRNNYKKVPMPIGNNLVILKDLTEDIGPMFGADIVITECDIYKVSTVCNLFRV